MLEIGRDLHILAAADGAQLRYTGDLGRKTNAARAMDATRHVAAREEVHRLQMRKARRADLAFVRFVGAIGDKIDPELALRRLNRGVHFAGGHVIALGVELEMMDERFHRALHLVTLGRHDLVVLNGHRSLCLGRAQLFAALFHEFGGLTHLFHGSPGGQMGGRHQDQPHRTDQLRLSAQVT